MEDPGGTEGFEHGGWTMLCGDPGIAKYTFDEVFASDALLLGRVTYVGFAATWPLMAGDQGFADRMNSLPKSVVSTTLDTVEWINSRLIRGKRLFAHGYNMSLKLLETQAFASGVVALIYQRAG